MVPPDETQDVGLHALGPHVVGARVVVRRLVPGRTGPTGGPAMTDVLGMAEAWAPLLVVRREDGTAVEIPHDLIVSGKPVPPRPSPRFRVSAAEVQARVRAMWTDDPSGETGSETGALGDWVLQATGDGLRRRTNSALAIGDAGVPDPAAAVADWYAARGRRPLAQVVVGSDEEALLRDAGWQAPTDRPEEGDGHVHLQLASLAQVRRTLTRLHRARPPVVPAGAGAPRVETAERDGTTLVLAEVVGPDGEVASARAALRDGWVGLRDVRVAAPYRRQGLARLVLDEALEVAAEQGVATAYLEVLGVNRPALALYEGLGFGTHHTYGYLTPG